MTVEEPSPFEFVVQIPAAGRRLDLFLADRLADHDLTRSRLQALIRQGLVTLIPAEARPGDPLPPTVNLKVGHLLKAGDRVAVRVPPPIPLDLIAEEVPFTLLYEDEDILVLAKPPGVVVHPAGGHWQGTLVHGLLHHCRNLSGISGELRPGIVHRLDKETSGCLVVAKSDRAHHELARQFKAKEVEKIYQALLIGLISAEQGRVELPIGRHPVRRKQMAVRREGGREALTHWRVLERFAAGYTLVSLRLETGRTHQIRVHMASLGHPVAGDALYGKGGDRDRRFAINRQWLHALHLSFNHPVSGERLRFTAPLWPDLEKTLALLRENVGEMLMELWGITGGIGAGKSRVAAWFAAQAGFATVDVDQLARELLQPGQAGWLALRGRDRERFFHPDGSVDRPRLRRAIFSDSRLRREIDNLLHPLIRQEMLATVARLRREGRQRILVEVPLLYEAGWEADFSRVIVVRAPAEISLARLLKRDGVSTEEAAAALAAQMVPEEKARRADLLVDNSGLWSETVARLEKIEKILEKS